MTYPRQAGKTRPPQYAGTPVILRHVGMKSMPTRTVCSGELFHQPRAGSYPLVPVVPCPLCVAYTTAVH